MWKINTALGAAGPPALNRSGLFGEHDRFATSPPPAPLDAHRKGRGSLTFHRILLGAHDVNQRALQGVHVETVVHSGAVLEKTGRCEVLTRLGRGAQRRQNIQHMSLMRGSFLMIQAHV